MHHSRVYLSLEVLQPFLLQQKCCMGKLLILIPPWDKANNLQERFDFRIKYDQEWDQYTDIGHHGESRELVQVPDPGENHHRHNQDGYPGAMIEVDVEGRTENLHTCHNNHSNQNLIKGVSPLLGKHNYYYYYSCTITATQAACIAGYCADPLICRASVTLHCRDTYAETDNHNWHNLITKNPISELCYREVVVNTTATIIT